MVSTFVVMLRKTRCSNAPDSSEDVEAVVPEEVEFPVPEVGEVSPTLPNVVEIPEVGRRYPARERHPPDRLSS